MHFPLAFLDVSIIQAISDDGKETNFLSMQPSESKIEQRKDTKKRLIISYLIILFDFLELAMPK
jgi:hypothetical protein